MKNYEAQLIYQDGQKVIHQVRAQTYQQACLRALRHPKLDKPLNGIVILHGDRSAGFDTNGRIVAGPTKLKYKTDPTYFQVFADQIKLVGEDGGPSVLLAFREDYRRRYRRVRSELEKRDLVFQTEWPRKFELLTIHTFYDCEIIGSLPEDHKSPFEQFENVDFPHKVKIKASGRTFALATKFIKEYITNKWSFLPFYESRDGQLDLYFLMRFERKTDAIVFRVGFEEN